MPDAADRRRHHPRGSPPALIDVIILGAIDAAVVLPDAARCASSTVGAVAAPAARCRCGAFLLLLCGGYFVLFTAAGGQTIGKMTTGIRVVAVRGRQRRPRARLRFGARRAQDRGCLGSVLALGTGFLPVLFSADRRAFHDRVAETRVVARVTRLAVFIATVGYCGYFPIAPGTVGSAAGLVVYLLVWWAQSPVVEVGADRRRCLRAGVWAGTTAGALLRRDRSRARS